MCKGKKMVPLLGPNEQQSTNNNNHPALVWGVWYLSLAGLTMIFCTVTLLICVSIVVEMLHLDLLLSLMLLTGIVMLPTNCYLLHAISKGKKIDPYATVFCWDLWICMATIILLNIIGACLCSHKLYHCRACIKEAIGLGMSEYKMNPKYKHLMDVLQWGRKCCGLNSYADWFNYDWYDSIRDYEWDPTSDAKLRSKGFITDSVPLSCCKSGTCISNYLLEMGTSSIHLNGCAEVVYEAVMVALAVQLAMFSSVFVVEILVFALALSDHDAAEMPNNKRKLRVYDIKQLLNVNPNFDLNGSLESASDDSAAEDSPNQAVREDKGLGQP